MIFMEHNHELLKYKFFLTIGMLFVGIGMGYLGASGSDFQSKVTIYFFGGLIVVIATIILRKSFKERDNCEICKYRFFYGKKRK